MVIEPCVVEVGLSDPHPVELSLQETFLSIKSSVIGAGVPGPVCLSAFTSHMDRGKYSQRSVQQSRRLQSIRWIASM
jgi:hypothetical protein